MVHRSARGDMLHATSAALNRGGSVRGVLDSSPAHDLAAWAMKRYASGDDLIGEGFNEWLLRRRVLMSGVVFAVLAAVLLLLATYTSSSSGRRVSASLAQGMVVMCGLCFGFALGIGVVSVWMRLLLLVLGVLGFYVLGAWLASLSLGVDFSGFFLGSGVYESSLDACGAFSEASMRGSGAFLRYAEAVCSGDASGRDESLRELTHRFHPVHCASSGCEETCRDTFAALRSYRCDP